MLKRLVPVLLAAGILSLATAGAPASAAGAFEPYGTAVDHSHHIYHGLKVVMDAGGATPADTAFQTMVAERLMQMPGTKLIMVIQGPVIRIFSKREYADHQGLVDRVAALRKKGVKIEFCGNSVQAVGLKPSDIIGIGTVVPGAYPAIANAERHGYALIKPIRFIPPHPAMKR